MSRHWLCVSRIISFCIPIIVVFVSILQICNNIYKFVLYICLYHTCWTCKGRTYDTSGNALLDLIYYLFNVLDTIVKLVCRMKNRLGLRCGLFRGLCIAAEFLLESFDVVQRIYQWYLLCEGKEWYNEISSGGTFVLIMSLVIGYIIPIGKNLFGMNKKLDDVQNCPSIGCACCRLEPSATPGDNNSDIVIRYTANDREPHIEVNRRRANETMSNNDD